MSLLLFAFPVAAAFAAALALVPLVRRLALRVGLVDRPDGHRKMHREAVALGGGVAVLLAAAFATLAALFLPHQGRAAVVDEARELGGLFCAAVLLCGVGLWDDYRGLRGRQKMLGQLCAISVLIWSGLLIRTVWVFEWKLDLGPLAVPFTVFWLLGAINSLNLLDGADGLASTVGIILSLTIGIMALMTGHAVEALVALALAGSLSGFLVFNFPPARIFLGDVGSQFIGYLFAVLGIALAIAVLGVLNTVLMSVMEKLREFGYMRCVGASPRDIFTIVLSETVTLCLIGGVLGVIVGALGSSVADQLIRQVLPYAPAGKMVVFDPAMLVLTLTVTVGIGALAGLYPS